MVSAPRMLFHFKTHWRAWTLGMGIFVTISLVLSWAGKGWIADRVTTVMRERLAERGLTAKWAEVSGSVWSGGATFRNLSLLENNDDKKPVVKIDSLKVGIPPWEWLRSAERRVTTWSIRNSKLILTDQEGSISLDHVSATVESRRGEIQIKQFMARKDGLEVDLRGEILPSEKSQQPGRFEMKLGAVRATLSALDFGGGQGTFKVTGSFEAGAAKDQPWFWNAHLKGNGEDLRLKGVPLKIATADAALTAGDSRINARLTTANGKADAVITRVGGWQETPFAFEGTLEDGKKHKDDFHGSYQNHALTISSLQGNADLWSIARDLPELVAGRSEALEFRQFPHIQAKEIQWNKNEGWSIGSLLIQENSEAVVKTGTGEIILRDLHGNTGYEGGQWQLSDMSAELLGGRISVSGSYRDGQLKKGKVQADGLQLRQIKQALGKTKGMGKGGILSLNYKGAVHFQNRNLNGSGSMRLENAPLIEVPVLHEVLDLFETLIPGLERSKVGRFDADFSADGEVIHVKRFEASGGTLVVIADGDVNLKNETVTGSARGRLTGLPGVVSSPLSMLLEMDVSGNFEDIRVKQLGIRKILSNAATGAVEVIKDAFDGTEEAGEAVQKKNE